MPNASWATYLNGECLSEPFRICSPFRSLNVHTLVGNPGPLMFPNGAGFYSCGKYRTWNPAGTGYIQPPTVVFEKTYSKAVVYGKSPAQPTDVVNLKHINGDDLYFNSTELDAWGERQMKLLSPNDPITYKASGPAINKAHFVTPLKRRLRRPTTPNNNSYAGRYSFEFTKAAESIYGQTDWLGALHPAGYFWCNKDIGGENEDTFEPFKAAKFYEDTQQSPRPTSTNNLWLLPFCNPITARDANGTALGNYIGYTVIYYLSFAFVHYGDTKLSKTGLRNGAPTNVFLPGNYHAEPDAEGNLPKIVHRNQLMSLQAVWFMVGTGGIGSPKIADNRYWHYNFGELDPCNPYFYWYGGQTGPNTWPFKVQFNRVNATPKQIDFGISSMLVVLAP